MKVAILLSGHIRTWEQCKNNFLQMLNIQNNKGEYPDVFIYVYRQKTNSYNGADKGQKNMTDDEINTLFSGMNVKKIVVDDETVHMKDYEENYSKYTNGVLLPVYGQGMGLMLANKLRKDYEKENNILYDVVVRTRFDIVIKSPVDYSLGLNNKNTIYNCMGGTYGYPNDMFAFGHRDVMDLYCDRIIKGVESLKTIRDPVAICSHSTLKNIIADHNIIWNTNVLIDIIRP